MAAISKTSLLPFHFFKKNYYCRFIIYIAIMSQLIKNKNNGFFLAFPFYK